MCFVKGPKNRVVAHVLRVLPPQREARGDQEPAEAAAKVAGMHHPWAPNWRFIFSVWLSSITTRCPRDWQRTILQGRHCSRARLGW